MQKKALSLVGKQYGRWTVFRVAGGERVVCRCECGTTRTVDTWDLLLGKSKSCGCLARDKTSARHPEIPAGSKFGLWTVLGRGEPTKAGKRRYRVKCECGTTAEVVAQTLTNGSSTGCGCTRRGHVTHGLSRHPLHGTWCTMKSRCFNPNFPKYKDYGARGITVCDRWRSDFAAFLADVGERPGPGYSLDRIDNDGNYEPGNVRWATAVEQMANRRCARRDP